MKLITKLELITKLKVLNSAINLRLKCDVGKNFLKQTIYINAIVIGNFKGKNDFNMSCLVDQILKNIIIF